MREKNLFSELSQIDVSRYAFNDRYFYFYLILHLKVNILTFLSVILTLALQEHSTA